MSKIDIALKKNKKTKLILDKWKVSVSFILYN